MKSHYFITCLFLTLSIFSCAKKKEIHPFSVNEIRTLSWRAEVAAKTARRSLREINEHNSAMDLVISLHEELLKKSEKNI